MRAANLHAIISTVRSSDAVSRGEIQERTHLSHGAVSQTVGELIENGWLREIESDGPRRKGRRTRLVTVNPDKASVLAIRVDSNGIKGAVFDLAENVTELTVTSLRPKANRDELLVEVRSVIRELIGMAPREVMGIGIAVPGSVDTLTGVAQSASRIAGWKDVDLRAEITHTFGKPTYVDNDVRLLARGHRSAKLIDDTDVALSVWLGEGIGVGITIDGQVFRGARGLAGELGHLHVEDEGRLCACGNRGCLETIASTEAIIERATSAISHGVSTQISATDDGQITLEAIAAALAEGDKVALTVCHEVARAIAKALAQAINLISPSKILLAGPLTVFGEPLLLGIKQHLQLYAHWEIMKDLDLESTGSSAEHILKGAAALAIDPIWSALEESM